MVYMDERAGIAGTIKWNKVNSSLDAHCKLCRLKVNKTYKPCFKKGIQVGPQGRPIGFHIALFQCVCFGVRAIHTEFLKTCDRKARQDARRWGKDQPELQELFDLDLERPRRLDESDDEPREAPPKKTKCGIK